MRRGLASFARVLGSFVRGVASFVSVAVLTGASAAVILRAPGGSPERVAGALLLALILPGFGLSSLLRTASGARRALLVPALSIAAVILDSAALYLAGVRLDANSWVYSLTAVSMVSYVAGLLCYGPPRLSLPRVSTLGLPIVAVSCALALLTGATLVTAHSVKRRVSSDHFTQLWALPSPGRPESVTIGIYNHEGRALEYQVSTRLDGSPVHIRTIEVGSGKSTTINQQHSARTRTLSVSISANRTIHRWVQLHFTPASRRQR
jgi:hypothetical protein